jgi:hypothetical protein
MAVARQQIVYLVADDTAPDLPVRFEGLDLSDYSPINMIIKYSSGGTISRTVTPDGSDSELGHVAWTAGDLIVGTHEAEFELTQISDSKILTLPRKYAVQLVIRADLS